MQIAQVIGRATSTIKHETLSGCRMIIAQPLGNDQQPDGAPLIAIDKLGSATGDRVILSSDGKEAQRVIGARSTPVRWMVMGLADE